MSTPGAKPLDPRGPNKAVPGKVTDPTPKNPHADHGHKGKKPPPPARPK
jgi:hypothetical protein